jgi:cell division protease FtsH
MAGGYAMMLPKEDRYMATRNELLDRVTGLLGGRVAEEIVFGEVSTGASNDFEKATGIVRAMITEYGMSEKLATMTFGRPQGQVFLGRDLGSEQNYSDRIAYEIDMEMQEMIRTCYNRAKSLLLEKRDKLELLAQTLLKRETLDEQQIRQLLDTGKLDDDDDVKVNIQGKDDPETEEGTGSAKAEESLREEGQMSADIGDKLPNGPAFYPEIGTGQGNGDKPSGKVSGDSGKDKDHPVQ